MIFQHQLINKKYKKLKYIDKSKSKKLKVVQLLRFLHLGSKKHLKFEKILRKLLL